MSKNFIKSIVKKIRGIIRNWGNVHTIVLFFVVFFFVIIKTLFTYTVLDYEYYTALADQQQI
jgi:hypothetical protein